MGLEEAQAIFDIIWNVVGLVMAVVIIAMFAVVIYVVARDLLKHM